MTLNDVALALGTFSIVLSLTTTTLQARRVAHWKAEYLAERDRFLIGRERHPVHRTNADGTVTDATAELSRYAPGYSWRDVRDLDGNRLTLTPGSSITTTFEIEDDE